MAPRKKPAVVEVEEVDELDELDDLEDLADDEEDVEDDDEDGEDEEEAPARKKKSTTKAKAKKKVSTTFGSSELAEALDTSGRELRVMLRQKKVSKNENNRYEWDDLDAALEDLGFDDVDEAKDALAESRTKRLDELKERVGATKKKSSTKGKKAKAEEPEEVDEYEDDEDDEPAPAPKKKPRRK